jgi:hypothetical protein
MYATPDEAVLFLGSLRERMTSIALNGREYVQAAELAAVGGRGGRMVRLCSAGPRARCRFAFVDSFGYPRAGAGCFW